MAPPFVKRDDDDDVYYCWWNWECSRRSEILKWTIFIGFLGIITLFFFIAYFHARHRIKNNLPPLPYHRWMVRNRMQPTANLASRPPPGAVLATYVQNERGEYVLQPMDHHHVPPAYNNDIPPPPVYPGPPGASKVDPNQDGFLGQQQTGTTFTSVGGTAGTANTTGESSSFVSVPPPAPAHTSPPAYYMPQTAPQQPGGPTHPQFTQ